VLLDTSLRLVPEKLLELLAPLRKLLLEKVLPLRMLLPE
jgi:hypothetical protein